MLASSFDKKDNMYFIQFEIANIMHHGVCTMYITFNSQSKLGSRQGYFSACEQVCHC